MVPLSCVRPFRPLRWIYALLLMVTLLLYTLLTLTFLVNIT
jgi:hypothetical protein